MLSQWQGRLETMAKHITTPSRVLDIGAGSMALEALLPHGSSYTPLDYKTNGRGIDADLERVSEIPVECDLTVIAGVLEHVADPRRLLSMALRSAPRALFSYVPLDECSMSHRHGWRSHVWECELLHGMNARQVDRWNDHRIYEATRPEAA